MNETKSGVALRISIRTIFYRLDQMVATLEPKSAMPLQLIRNTAPNNASPTVPTTNHSINANLQCDEWGAIKFENFWNEITAKSFVLAR